MQEGEQVGDTHIVHRSSVQIRRQRDACERRIAAVTGAINSDSFRVGNALGNQPLHAVGDVVLHAQAPLAKAGFPELATIAGGAAKVDLQHGIAAIGEKLHLGVVAPAVTRPGATMRVDDDGQIFCLSAHWQGQIAVNFQPVVAGVFDGLHGGHVAFSNGWIHLAQQRQGIALGIKQIAFTGCTVVVSGNDKQALILVAGLQADFIAGQQIFKLRKQLLRDVIEEVKLWLIGLITGHGEQLALA